MSFSRPLVLDGLLLALVVAALASPARLVAQEPEVAPVVAPAPEPTAPVGEPSIAAAPPAAPPVAAEPADPVPADEYAPIDDETRARERVNGLLGLVGWTVLGVGLGLFFAFRWQRSKGAPPAK